MINVMALRADSWSHNLVSAFLAEPEALPESINDWFFSSSEPPPTVKSSNQSIKGTLGNEIIHFTYLTVDHIPRQTQ